MKVIQKGLDSFSLKIIALILMVFDHLHYFFSSIYPIPMWFTMLGRLSAPLFIFIVINGMCHTRNAIKYMMRLYIGNIVMMVGDYLINRFFPLPFGAVVMNNIFATLFVIALMVYSIQRIVEAIVNKKKVFKYILLFLLPIVSSIIPLLLSKMPIAMMTAVTLLPNVVYCEGSIVLVLMGLGFYIFRKSKLKLSLFYIIFCILYVLLGCLSGLQILDVLKFDIQWMMIFSLPFILLYNDKKGKGMKYFFYAFYPAHIYTFALVAYFLSK